MKAYTANATARAAARQTLGQNGVRLHLLVAQLICLAFWSGSLYLNENLFSVVPWARLYNNDHALFDMLNTAFYVMDAILLSLIGLPLIYGLLTLIYGVADGRAPVPTTLFCAFSSLGLYLRSLVLTGAVILPRVVAFFAFRGALVWCFSQDEGLRPLVLILLLALLLLVLWLLGLGDAILPLAVGQPSLRPHQVIGQSLRISGRRLGKILTFKLSFLHWGVLSLCSLGVIFFFHALPYYTISQFYLIQNAYEQNRSVPD